MHLNQSYSVTHIALRIQEVRFQSSWLNGDGVSLMVMAESHRESHQD